MGLNDDLKPFQGWVSDPALFFFLHIADAAPQLLFPPSWEKELDAGPRGLG